MLTKEQYLNLYQESMTNPDAFWARQAERLTWFKKWSTVSRWSFEPPVQIEWFAGGQLNATVNCLDRHLPQRANDTAYIWVPENPDESPVTISYGELARRVNQLAQALKRRGVKKGDRVTLYMPMIPETVYSILACARIGAVHSVVFAGFSPEALRSRIQDCDSHFVITADQGWRAGKAIDLKANTDAAITEGLNVRHVLVVRRTGESVPWQAGRDLWYHEEIRAEDTACPPEVMDAEDPLFILYTSGSTGRPKGVLHTTGGYLVFASLTFATVFDYQPGQVYWCAADIGWVTGHSYIVYGPLLNGATSVLYEGAPTYPGYDRLWQIVDQQKVATLYTAPTLIRALMREGDAPLSQSSRASLKLLGSVGEPINPEAWHWYHEVVGRGHCPIVDTWWQTETGGIMITPLPGMGPLKPGAAMQPFFGSNPVIFDEHGREVKGEGRGDLYLRRSWPGQMRTVFRDHARFEATYFQPRPGYFYTGDECVRDKDGDLWIIGRADDVLNVSGHRIGTAEVESALVLHAGVAEAAVVGIPHAIKGQALYAFVTLQKGTAETEELRHELRQMVRREIGAFAQPDVIQWAPNLPKTRSGKIMRRVLRRIAAGEREGFGDLSTLAEASVIDELLARRPSQEKPA